MIRVYKVRRRGGGTDGVAAGGVGGIRPGHPPVPVGAGDPAPPELCTAGLGGCGHLLIAEREGQPVEFMGVEEVTVNEQNPHAVGFYRHMGFEVYRRTDCDEEGGPYPLLYMRWENHRN